MERQEEMKSLYTQAALLAESGNWRGVLENIEKIRALDPAFADPRAG